VPAFLYDLDARNSGTQLCQREAYHCYLETHFKKAHGAPVSWERFQRSKPQHELDTDRMGGMFREAIYPHSHFHIFASLPGLNGSAHNGRGDYRLING
jgi:hypothetical protein